MAEMMIITGGARSGKSRFAESLLAGHDDVLYIATALPCDLEMEERIARHKQARNPHWTTIETFEDIGSHLAPYKGSSRPILLDCITLLLSNLLLQAAGPDPDNMTLQQADAWEGRITSEVDTLLGVMQQFAGMVLIVTNEVGMGLVPAYPLGRFFRDLSGRVNQKLAAQADKVYWLVSGIPVKIKG